MKQVYWLDYTRNVFLQESGLIYRSELGSQEARELIVVLKKHIADKTNSQIAEEMHFTESKVDEMIRELKNMYDDVVFYTTKLIPRTNLTKKDEETQTKRYGIILTTDNLKKVKGIYGDIQCFKEN